MNSVLADSDAQIDNIIAPAKPPQMSKSSKTRRKLAHVKIYAKMYLFSDAFFGGSICTTMSRRMTNITLLHLAKTHRFYRRTVFAK